MKNFKYHFALLLVVFIPLCTNLSGQTGSQYTYTGTTLNTITTAVPFLIITPDARAGGLGESGVSTSPDVNSQFWNPSKYAFAKKRMGASLSYSPWLRALVNDLNLEYISVYYKPDSNQCIAVSFKGFSSGQNTAPVPPFSNVNFYNFFECAGDLSYSRKLSENFSCGLAFRYIYSDIGNISIMPNYTPGTSFAGDFSLFYTKPISIYNNEGRFNFGLNISNIGSKVKYSKDFTTADFIPTRLMLGPSFTLPITHRSSVTFTIELSKLLVPTPPIYSTDSTGNHIIAGKDPNVSVLQGMIQSFNDAPGGFKEEMKEVDLSSGIEFLYGNLFAIRTGFFYEDKTKGNRKFLTFGAGLRYNNFALDVAYLLPIEIKNPLQNTMRFTLSANIDSFKRRPVICAGMKG